MTSEAFHKGVFLTLLSAIGLSIIGLLGKLGGEILSLPALLFWRFFAAFVLCLLFVFLRGYFKSGLLKGSQFKINFARAFFTLGAQGSFYYYIQTNTLLNGLVLLN